MNHEPNCPQTHMSENVRRQTHCTCKKDSQFMNHEPYFKTQAEVWVSVPNYEGFYEVSDKGRVRSLDRISCGKKCIGSIMSTFKSGKYQSVDLSRDGVREKFSIHRLVLMSFEGLHKTKLHCNHIDGDKHNNSLENLEWVTPSENRVHAVKNGLDNPRKGDTHPNSKLNTEIVIECRKIWDGTSKHIERLAAKYNVSPSTIRSVVLRTAWKHVPVTITYTPGQGLGGE